MSEQTPTDGIDTQGTNNNISQLQSRDRNKNQRNKFRRANSNFDQSNFFMGATEDIGATLSLPNERISSDKGFEHFAEKLENHVLRNLTNAGDVVTIITELVDPTQAFIDNMPDPVFNAQQVLNNPFRQAVNDQMAKDFARSIHVLKSNVTKIYSLVWGQCTSALQSEIKSIDDYDVHAATYDTLWLLKTVKRVSSGVVTRGNGYSNMLNVISRFFHEVYQGQNESEDSWYKRFRAECNTLKSANLGYIFYNFDVAGHTDPNNPPTANQIAEETEKCRAMFFLKFSNMNRYPDLMDFLRNSEMVNNDQYPTTLVGVYELLLQYRNREQSSSGRNKNNRYRHGGNSQSTNRMRVSFLQSEMTMLIKTTQSPVLMVVSLRDSVTSVPLMDTFLNSVQNLAHVTVIIILGCKRYKWASV